MRCWRWPRYRPAKAVGSGSRSAGSITWGGYKPEGQAIFDDVLANDPEGTDLFRIARIYREAGEWERAKALFERALRENPKDSQGMAEVGAYYLLLGDRAAAEALFDRSFNREDELWSTVAAAGSYLGVAPQE